ncbi:uncharacterized protein K452DRAFT_303730 [Aplosporella prunicola CBS 121167]|uniref:Fucose-specific lectin n=1 Tax=Aplosporella prunicola CBS 121167 TaxID=1176127 RepID=A0A6A6AW68_9PEZI|nr:uncharacterized protein K452DRAFT_303730 [Aplosporella prunicola CBS 121167]KAF2135184.1 hypothetical protein K452DRAFT_303730 [Aplosporella prunicola CBS 121167]
MSGQDVDYSTLEVDRRAPLPEVDRTSNLPEVKPGDDPEALPQPAERDLPEAIHVDNQQEKTYCGFQRKTIAITLLLAILVAIGIGVGVGVGVTRNRDSNKDSSNNTAANQHGILPNSSLAAANYTDTSGIEHAQVFFQDKSSQIYMADRSIPSNEWALSSVKAQGNASHPKLGTPIAAYNFYWATTGNTDNQTDFHCMFMDNSSTISGVFSSNQSLDWQTDGKLSPGYNANPNGRMLATYIRQCTADTCITLDLFAFLDEENSFKIRQPFKSITSVVDVATITVDPNTVVAFLPVPQVTAINDTDLHLAMYFRNTGGSLVELYKDSEGEWYKTKMRSDLPLDSGCNIAASSKLDDNLLLNVQVLSSKSSGGVRMAFLNGTAWNSVGSVQGMENVLPLSPISATQTGKVFAFEEGPAIVEWARVDGSPPSFDRVGVINTTITD